MADKIKIWQTYRYLEARQIYEGLESSADTLEIWKLGRHNRDLEAKKSSENYRDLETGRREMENSPRRGTCGIWGRKNKITN